MRQPIIQFTTGDSRKLDYPDGTFHCAAFSPPYFGQRVYGDGNARQVGVEKDVTDYVNAVADIAMEAARCVRADGNIWINIGDKMINKRTMGVPWRVALALADRGLILRQEIIWAKGISYSKGDAGSVIGSVAEDRCTPSHEPIFLFAKQPDYCMDMEAIREREGDAAMDVLAKSRAPRTVWRINTEIYKGGHFATWPTRLVGKIIAAGTSAGGCCQACGKPFQRAIERKKLYRVRPNKLTKRMGEAGTGNYVPNDVDGVATRTIGFVPDCECAGAIAVPCRVLDCFGGAGSTAIAAWRAGRDCVCNDLMDDYTRAARERFAKVVSRVKHKGGRAARTEIGEFERSLFAEVAA